MWNVIDSELSRSVSQWAGISNWRVQQLARSSIHWWKNHSTIFWEISMSKRYIQIPIRIWRNFWWMCFQGAHSRIGSKHLKSQFHSVNTKIGKKPILGIFRRNSKNFLIRDFSFKMAIFGSNHENVLDTSRNHKIWPN